MSERPDRIRVHIAGKEFNVVGGSFQEMLAAVKQINGRRFIAEVKAWQLPGDAEAVQRQLAISGYQLEGGKPLASDRQMSLPQNPAVRASGDRIRVRMQGHQLEVVGGTFQDMLAVIKQLPGRRFDRETKAWEIPGEVSIVKNLIETAGFSLNGVEKIAEASETQQPAASPPTHPTLEPPPPYEKPEFFDEVDEPVYEPPDWWDDENMPPPPEPPDWWEESDNEP